MPMPAVSDRRAAMALAAIMTLFLAIAPCEGGQLPQYDDVVKRRVSSEAVLLDRHGDIIHEMRIDAHGRRLAWTRLDDVSPALIAAVLYSEDRHFHEHGGVDWKALAAAALQNLFSGRQRGASTITMQLAGMLEKDLTPPKGKRRSFEQKWNQVQAARKLEQTWTKSHILEAYLNLVSFRGELQGITSAARGIFGKEPSGLQDAESFILAALLRSPNTAPATAANRACTLAASMKSADACTEIQALAEQHLAGGYRIRQQTALAPHIAHQFLDRDHPRVRTTLDGPLQKFAVEMLSQQIRQLSPQNVNDGAVLVADNKTGAILAYVASAGSDASARHVDGILARRQAGSTLKPLLYALAIEHRLLTAASLLDDSPLNLPTETGLYVPRNYDNAFKGPVSARLSLASSLNIPAVQTLLLVGPEAFVARLKKLGFTDLNDADYYGYALALGTVDVSLHELTNAFRTLANQGVWSPLSVEDGKRSGNTRTVMSSDAAFIVSDILSDRSARSLTFGLENPLATRYWTAVKTGTSKDMRDNWCIGYSERYTVGIWIGNFSGAPMWNVSGTSGAAPLWLEVMNYLHRTTPSKQPIAPPGVVSAPVSFTTAYDSTRREWFLKGTEITEVRAGEHHTVPQISYPSEGTLIALDPDIPPDRQFVFFRASAAAGYDWYLDGTLIASSEPYIKWKPEEGRHLLSISGSDGAVLDAVSFQVRGYGRTVTEQPVVSSSPD